MPQEDTEFLGFRYEFMGFAELATFGVDATQTDANAAQTNLDTNNFYMMHLTHRPSLFIARDARYQTVHASAISERS